MQLNNVLKGNDYFDVKHKVAVHKVFDSSSMEDDSNLSEEFSFNIVKNISKHKNLYINKIDESHSSVDLFDKNSDNFSLNLHWVNSSCQTYDFVVFTELVEYDIHPKSCVGTFIDKITPESELSLTMRIRVFDVRGRKPNVVLQELLHKDYLINHIRHKPSQTGKKLNFDVSSLDRAHLKFSKEVSDRIVDYIMIYNRYVN